MTYSPSPQPGAQMAAGISSKLARPSPTPPVPQPMSKRAKRANALSDRLIDISTTFALNRDAHYRRQLQSYQLDMNFINQADPYQDHPLDDLGDDIVSATMAGNAQGGQQGSQLGAPPRTGKWASVFVKEINDAMEDRDTELTLVAERHSIKIQDLKDDKEHHIQVAELEHQKLVNTIHHRLVHAVGQNKTNLNKERDKFDITDTSSLRLHANYFTIANPASPGGAQSNRKTRHTRHRLEVDDLSAFGESHKKKRKAPADADNDSPGPVGRIIEPESVQAWREGHDKREARHNPGLFLLERLFSEKDLVMTQQIATLKAVELLSNKRRKITSDSQKAIGDSQDATDTGPMNIDIEEDEEVEEQNIEPSNAVPPNDDTSDDVFLAAPEMDRTANNSLHATRSTRTLNPSAASTLGPEAGRAAAVPFIGTYGKEKKKEDDFQKVASLNMEEKYEDLALIAAAIADEKENKGKNNKKMLRDFSRERQDYIGH